MSAVEGQGQIYWRRRIPRSHMNGYCVTASETTRFFLGGSANSNGLDFDKELSWTTIITSQWWNVIYIKAEEIKLMKTSRTALICKTHLVNQFMEDKIVHISENYMNSFVAVMAIIAMLSMYTIFKPECCLLAVRATTIALTSYTN